VTPGILSHAILALSSLEGIWSWSKRARCGAQT
jgi:hypothetical protein